MKVWLPSIIIIISLSPLSGLAVEDDFELDEEVSQSDTVPKDKTEEAQNHIEKGEFKEAVELLMPLRTTLSRRGLMVLAKAYAGQKDTMNELKILQLAVAQNPKDYVVITAYADSLLRSKRNEEAITHYQTSREINPRFEPTYDGLFRALEVIGDRYEARALLNDMMKRFGEKPKYLSAMCRLLTIEAFLDKAVEACRAATRKEPENPDNHVNLGQSLLDLEKPKEAESVITRAAKKFPKSEAIQLAAGKLYTDRRNFVSAHRYYKKATEANPNSASAWSGFATSAFQLLKNDEALEGFIKSCKLDRKLAQEFRVAASRLRERGDTAWRLKFESGLTQCK